MIPRLPRRLGLALGGLALALASGCASQGDVDRAVADDLRFTGRILGFALDSNVEALETQLALLEAMKDDPVFPRLTAELGTIDDVKAKLERVQGAKRTLMEEYGRLQERYGAAEQE